MGWFFTLLCCDGAKYPLCFGAGCAGWGVEIPAASFFSLFAALVVVHCTVTTSSHWFHVCRCLIPARIPIVCCRWRQTTSKITIPGRKWVYRLLSGEGVPILDIMLKDGETPPQPGVPVLAR